MITALVARARHLLTVRRLVAALILLNGMLDLALAVGRSLPERGLLLRAVLPLEVSLGSRTLTVVAGFALIMLARGLARGKRHAWRLALPLLLVAAALHLLKDLDVEQASFALLLAALLWLRRHDYRSGSDEPSLRRGYVALVAGVALASAYSVGGLLLLQHGAEPVLAHHAHVGHGGVGRAVRAGLRLVAFQHVHLHPAATPHAVWFVQSVPVLSAVSLLYGLVMILRPAVMRGSVTPEDRTLVRALVRGFGRNPLAPYALQEDKALFFNAARTAGLAYRVAGEVAVVAGDPIGPAEEVPALLDEFRRFCQPQGWLPAFYQVLPEMVPLYRTRGFKVLKIGEEALLDLPSFTLSGKRMSNVRHSATHAERAGLHVHIQRLADLDGALHAQLAAISRAWLGGKMSAEMGFSMGAFGEVLDDEALVALAQDAAGCIHAFITLLPLPAQGGWLLDLMRRRADASGGAMELLLARTAEYLRDRGDHVFSLSLAPLADTQPTTEDAGLVVRRSRAFLYGHFDHLYNYRSLQRFKDKFNPRWEERFLAYPAEAPLATVIAAVVRVHLTLPGRAPAGQSTPRPVEQPLPHSPSQRVEQPMSQSSSWPGQQPMTPAAALSVPRWAARAAHDAIGGHAAVRGAIVEDFALARRLRARGRCLGWVDGRALVRVRMYRSLAELWQGWGKNLLLPGLLGGVERAGLVLLTVLVGPLPYLLMLVAAARLVVGPPDLLAWLAPALAALAVGLLLRLQWGLRPFHTGGARALLLHPLGAAIVPVLAVAALWRQLRHAPTTWRGRHYRLDDPCPSTAERSAAPSTLSTPREGTA